MTIQKPESFAIKRSQWFRGKGGGASVLLRRQDGKMCCLGFYGIACGIPVERLTGIPSPCRLANEVGIRMPDMVADTGHNSMLAASLIDTNDSEILLEHEREAKIAAGFKEIGVTVTFED